MGLSTLQVAGVKGQYRYHHLFGQKAEEDYQDQVTTVPPHPSLPPSLPPFLPPSLHSSRLLSPSLPPSSFCNLVLWQRRTAPLAGTSGSKAKGPKFAQRPSTHLRPLPNSVVDPTHSHATLSGAMRCGRAAHPSFKGKSTLRSIRIRRNCF